ncbi:MAG: hypothetical protein QNK29_00820 [Desulfobacterales bacterium]|nr:hypothetical protein [Desulfobacterales bacterium]MDX2510569.1 hypothetical protein [Desulfobacterales bacterium]
MTTPIEMIQKEIIYMVWIKKSSVTQKKMTSLCRSGYFNGTTGLPVGIHKIVLRFYPSVAKAGELQSQGD